MGPNVSNICAADAKTKRSDHVEILEETFCKASMKGDLEQVRSFLAKDNLEFNFCAVNALHQACSKGHLEIVKMLLSHPDIDVNQQTPLHHAVDMVRFGKNWIDVCSYLLGDKRVRTDIKCARGKTPIQLTTNEEVKSLFNNRKMLFLEREQEKKK